MKKRILITGSSGFLGRYLIKYAPAEYEIIAQYRSKKPDDYGKQVNFLQMDFLHDSWEPLERLQVDGIIHAAASASIDECEQHPELTYRMNVEATRKLVDYSRRKNARFIYLSSDVIFDGKKGNYSETDPPSPQSVYAKSKIKAEEYVLAQHPNAVVVRPALFYGLALDGRPSFTEIMLKNLRAGKEIRLFTDQYRTPILVNNLAEALWELMGNDFRGIIHLGGAQKITRYEMGVLMCEMFGLDKRLLIPTRLQEVKLIAPRPLDCSLDISLARRLLRTRFVDCAEGYRIAYL